jgi:hypothetical protein
MVGLINWLRQPGQLLNQPKKSMRVNSYQLIKSFGPRPDSYRDGKKCGIATQMATRQTAGPLAQIDNKKIELATQCNLLNFSIYCIINNSIWTLPSLNLFLDNF